MYLLQVCVCIIKYFALYMSLHSKGSYGSKQTSLPREAKILVDE